MHEYLSYPYRYRCDLDLDVYQALKYEDDPIVFLKNIIGECDLPNVLFRKFYTYIRIKTSSEAVIAKLSMIQHELWIQQIPKTFSTPSWYINTNDL